LHCQSIAVRGAFKTGAAKSCFINDMVKKQLSVTKLVACNANKRTRLFSCRSSVVVERVRRGAFRRQSMIRKSGSRFSEKIMLQQKARL
jgi:hypothetical protein